MPRKPAALATVPATKVSATAASASKSKSTPTEAPRPVQVVGLAKYIALSRRVDSLSALRDESRTALLPKLLTMHLKANASATKVADIIKSVPACERAHGAAASIQLASRKKEATGLTEDTIRLLTHAKIPLKLEVARTVLNPKYAGFEDATPAKMAEAKIETARVIAALAKLVAANPDAGIPADLFSQTIPRSLPGDDAVLRALTLTDSTEAMSVLPLLVDVRVGAKQIEEGAYNALLDGINTDKSKDADSLAGKLKSSFDPSGGVESEDAPKPRRAKTPTVIVPVAAIVKANRPAARRRA